MIWIGRDRFDGLKARNILAHGNAVGGVIPIEILRPKGALQNESHYVLRPFRANIFLVIVPRVVALG